MRYALGIGFACAVLLAMSGCGGDDARVIAAVQAEPESPAAPADPYAWTDVAYADYRAAALQVPIRPEFLVTPGALTQSLDTVCTTDLAGYTELLSAHRHRARDASEAAQRRRYLAEEVSLRLGMACPQRMADWATARAAAQGGDTLHEAGGLDSDGRTEASTSNPRTRRSHLTRAETVEGSLLPSDPYVEDYEAEDLPGSVAGNGGS